MECINNSIAKIKPTKYDYIAFYNPDWFGVANATNELFDNSCPMKEIYRKTDIKKIKDKINESKTFKTIKENPKI